MTSTEMPVASRTSVYPGEYEPLPRRKQELLITLKKIQATEPPFNIIEMADHYTIELAVPGFRREDFFVFTKGSSLSIAALNSRQKEKCKIQLHGFNAECILHDIKLPAGIDTDYYMAEYKDGILSISFYKPGKAAHVLQGPLVVY